MSSSFVVLTVATLVLPYGMAYGLSKRPSQEFTLISCFSLLLLGVSLATLSTLNFSLGLITGLLASPLSFIRPLDAAPDLVGKPPSDKQSLKTIAMLVALTAACPNVVILAGSAAFKGAASTTAVMNGLREVLVHESFAWHVSGTWTSVIIWVVWWPAWLAGAVVAATRLCGGTLQQAKS